MKKYFSIVAISVLLISAVSAQTEYDALKLTQTDIIGTARYTSMGGAFGALGGDASALKDNPAGLGVFRSSELAFTLNGTYNNSTTNLNSSITKENDLNLNFNHISYVLSMPTQSTGIGLLSSNFSFTYNKVRDFNRTISLNGSNLGHSLTDFIAQFTYDANLIEEDLQFSDNFDPYTDVNAIGTFAPWLSVLGYQGYLINPGVDVNNYTTWSSGFGGKINLYNNLFERGSINEYGFGWGGNFSNKVFLGANLNISSIDYNLEAIVNENFSDGGNYRLVSFLSQSGIGVNFKMGAIALLTNSLRVGAALHTPTFYTISEANDFSLQSSESTKKEIPSVSASQTYSLSSAFQAQGSLAYVFGKKGLISAEYNYANYPGMKFSDTDGNSANYRLENSGMSEVLRGGHLIKLGGEYKINNRVALRAGYAFATGATNPKYDDGKKLQFYTTHTNTEYFDHLNTQYYSLGVGYREASWFVDVAYALKVRNENFYSNQGAPGASSTSNSNNLVCTLGFKF